VRSLVLVWTLSTWSALIGLGNATLSAFRKKFSAKMRCACLKHVLLAIADVECDISQHVLPQKKHFLKRLA
jgi:hypothetical protein